MDSRRSVMMSRTGVACLLCLAVLSQADAATLTNGDFERGDLSGWTLFTTASGTIGGAGFPMVFDLGIRDDGFISKSAAFKVGQQVYQGPDSETEGGGIYQTVNLEAGQLALTADIAVTYSSSRHGRNLSGGFFELILDNIVLDKYDFGPITAGTTERGTLSASTRITAGVHEVRLRITRPAVAKGGTPAPVQFVDNVQGILTPSAKPAGADTPDGP